jgi:hypothetical protein
MADERRLVYGEHQKIFGQIEGKHRVEIRPELSQSIESVTEASAVPSISTLSSTYMVGPIFARLVILCCWCSNMETRLEFLCSTSASWIMKDHFAITTTSSNQWSITGDVGRHYERWYYGSLLWSKFVIPRFSSVISMCWSPKIFWTNWK